ncbi:MAG: filamentous hemagglutinin N-terminal domain-containing protein, partial [Sphingobium sp.]
MIRNLFIGVAICALVAGSNGAEAQTTSVTASTGNQSLGTTVTRNGATLTIDGGTAAGPNLYHSFNTFSLAPEDTARWTWTGGDRASIQNVVNRVTGDRVSAIGGTIDSMALPNASFYFINPRGITFTATATVNVPAAAHFSSASDLRMADGATFAISTPNGSTLSMAPPASFGFLGTEGAVQVRDSDGGLTSSRVKLGLSGTSILINNATFTSGGLDAFAIGSSPYRLDLADPLGSGPMKGSLAIGTSTINVLGGDIRLGADFVNVVSGTIFGRDRTTQAGGVIDIRANRLRMNVGVLIGALSSTGRGGGDIHIDVATLDILRDAQLFTRTSGAGKGGSIVINAPVTNITGGTISADSRDGASGSAGNIGLNADMVTMKGGTISSVSRSGTGNAGSVTVDATGVNMTEGAVLSTSTQTSGRGGLLKVVAQDLKLDGGIIAANSAGSGLGGAIQITADTIMATNEARIAANAFGTGDAGSITIMARTASFDQATFISTTADTTSNAKGGNITLTADTLALKARSRLNAATTGGGSSGDITVTARDFMIDGANTGVEGSTFGSGAAGTVRVTADNLTLTNFGKIASQVSATATGNGGLVEINAGKLSLASGATITGATKGAGNSGEVRVIARQIGITGNGTAILSSTERSATGNAGALTVKADSIMIENNGAIAASTIGPGNAGRARVETASLTLRTGGKVSSLTSGTGNAGTIEISAGSVMLNGAAAGIASSSSGAGNGGRVILAADTLAINGGTISSASSGTGDAGNIALATGTMSMTGGLITSNATGTVRGASGSVALSSDQIILRSGARIATSSANPSAAGSIVLTAPLVDISDPGSAIDSTNSAVSVPSGGTGGAAGSVRIN